MVKGTEETIRDAREGLGGRRGGAGADFRNVRDRGAGDRTNSVVDLQLRAGTTRGEGRERGSAETSVASITMNVVKRSNLSFLKSEEYERLKLEASSARIALSSFSLHSAASASRCSRQLTASDPCSNPRIQQSN